MPQKTNLNVNPYFDDFDLNKNFYRVLFNPGRPVQARELNTIQSIFQNQLESFGSNIFKDGSIVIPGSVTYDSNFYAVKLNPTNFGVDISLYIQQYVGKKIVGQVSGITASVQYVAFPDGGDIEYITLYVKYIESDNNFEFRQFEDGESISSIETIVYGNTSINSGTIFASLLSAEATSIGSAASIDNGIYFIRGNFISVNKQTILLDPYTNNPSYRVGLRINEQLITAKDDNSLYDNAKGFTNYASPGADRLKISLSLTKKLLDDSDDTDFVEILRLRDGKIKIIETKTQYNLIRDYLAQRTYDESGDYVVNPFSISLHNSLNDGLGNDGMYFETEKTDQGNIPSNDLMSVKVSPGKGYIRGYDVEKTGITILDIEKPRETQTVSQVSIPFEMGNLLRVNNVTGSPKQRLEVELYNQRKNSNSSSTGTKIGDARVYNFNLTDSSYTDNSSSWDLYLYDIQTYTTLVLNGPLSNSELPATSFVKGLSSGATGYSVSSGENSSTVSLRQTSGSFIVGEQVLINGLNSPSRTISSVTSYGIDDIKSVFQSSSVSGFSFSFSSDTILDKFNPFGFSATDTITIQSNGQVSSSGKLFTGLKVGSILRYNKVGSSLETYNRISSISNDGLSITLSAVPNVSGICDGTLPSSATQTTFSIGIPQIRNNDKSYLYAPLPNTNISNVNLDNSILSFNSQSNITPTVSGNTLTVSINNFNIPVGISTIFFQSFDAERFSIHYSDGTIESLTSDEFTVSENQVTFYGISNKTVSAINASFIKSGIQSKIKTYNRSQIVNILYSKYPESGSAENNSINDGLIYNQFYGLRAQDEEICLNYPDVSNVLAVYESLNNSLPTFDELEFSSVVNISDNAIIGENIVGKNSRCIARVVANPNQSPNNVGIIYLNSNRFEVGEIVTFKESNISSNIKSISLGSYKDITNSFSLDRGQKEQYYDYSKLIRNKGETEPSKKLLIVFDHYIVPPNDNGDVFTVESYSEDRYQNDIPNIGLDLIRCSDTLDFRPRVPTFTSINFSPFDFSARNFGSEPKFIVSPGESSIIGYEFYLGRIDKVYLDKFGSVVVEKGISSSDPKQPTKIDEVMDLATIILPPYLYTPSDAQILLVDNRRYTMRDIGKIEDRIEKLEITTSLSLLELNTQTLQIQDAQGFNRFKTGFFVDDFSSNSLINLSISTVEIDPIRKELIPLLSRNSLKSLIVSSEPFTDEEIDLSDNFTLLDPNIQKTGNTVTLKYESTPWIEQPFATAVENVNPFHVVQYTGTITLMPNSDTWIRTVRLPDRIINQQNNLNLSNTINTANTQLVSTFQSVNNGSRAVPPSRRPAGTVNGILTQTSTNVSSSQSTASSTSVSSASDTVSIRTSELVDSSIDVFMRSRNTQFSISGLKPFTKYYQFFDGNSSVDFVPKLIEIANSPTLENYGSIGTFTPGETVIGRFGGRQIISFRVAQTNHKVGPFRSPTSVYNANPYIKNESIPASYSPSSKVLNVDTFSLSEEAQGLFSGYLTVGTILIGQTSGAVAYVKDLRLISDNYGDLIGTFFLRDPNASPPPPVRITTGNKTYKVTSSSTNQQPIPGSTSTSSGETSYVAQGTVNTFQTVVNNITTTVNLATTQNTTTTTIRSNTVESTTRYTDPLAQTFTVGGNIEAPSPNNSNDDVNGAFLTAVDLYFYAKDSGNSPLTVQVRTTLLGTPTRTVLGNSVTLRPDQINISDDASIPTKVVFDYPIYLAPGTEYAIVLLAPESIEYEVWIAEMGKKTINTKELPDASSVLYNTQFAMGSLFKSQNGSIWSANQYQDMKFKLYKAEFTSNAGTAFFNNPSLDKSNSYVSNLINNPITTLPRKLSVGITTITNTQLISQLKTGRKISEDGVGSKPFNFGYIVGTGSSVSSISVTNSGKNYVTDSNVLTYPISGSGSGLVLSISASSGQITSASIVSSGNGYSAGDIVGIVTSSVSSNTGRDALITISQIHNNGNSIDTLYLSNVQGTSFTPGSSLVYYDNSGNRVATGSGTTSIVNSRLVNNLYDGTYVKIEHFDHGMYAPNNKVEISGASPSLSPSPLTSQLSVSGSTINIAIGETFKYSTFEGIPISQSNPGYVKIDDEIIRYETVGNGTLESLTRGVDSSIIVDKPINSLVYKYEMNGVSLRRINTIHDIVDENIGIDTYYLKIDSSANGTTRQSDGSLSNSPSLSFESEGKFGESDVYASENIMYTAVIPSYEIITPGSSTSVSTSIRTVSGTSVNGREISFLDQGFEPVQLGQQNRLPTTRIVASKSNENQYLINLPRRKSFTTAISLNSSDKNLSPLIFLDTAETIFITPRINSPISNYILDSKVNTIIDDPHASVYYSNTVKLSQPATTLKVLLSAYKDSTADFRVLYSLIRSDSSEIEQKFELFPGYNNLISDNNQDGYLDIVDISNNSGLPDLYVPESLDNQFLEYQYTAPNVGLFYGYSLKIVMSGTNAAKYPKFKDLRTIAIR